MIPKLSYQFVKEKIDEITSPERREQRQNDRDRFNIYNGNLIPSIKKAIEREFKKPETVSELLHRLVPINIVRKIIIKLAGIYLETPARTPADRNEMDQELLNLIEDSSAVNSRFKEANRYFKLFKRNLMEVLIDDDGFIKLRNLPRHTYEVFSHSPTSPDIPDLIVKILVDDDSPEKQKFAFWTESEFLIVNGLAEIDVPRMSELNNLEGSNPYGVLPFVYINESSFSINPIPNDDLLRLGILIPVLLSDLAFASKYQTWSIIYVTGYDGDLPASPNSIISLPMTADGQRPEIGTVKPEFSMDSALQYIESLIDFLLSTNNLSTTQIGPAVSVRQAASGIAKALDEAESTEDKIDQQEYFLRAEGRLWEILSKNLIPYWRRNRMLNSKINREFSAPFEVTVTLREPKITLTPMEQIDLSAKKLEKGLSTVEIELSALNPDMSQEEVQQLALQIEQDKMDNEMRQSDMIAESIASRSSNNNQEDDDDDSME